MAERAWQIVRRAWRKSELKVSDRDVCGIWIDEVRPLVDRIAALEEALLRIQTITDSRELFSNFKASHLNAIDTIGGVNDICKNALKATEVSNGEIS